MGIHKQKNLFRERIKQKIEELQLRMHHYNRLIRDRLSKCEALQQADTIMCYSPLKDEIDLLPLYYEFIAIGKKLAFPRVESDYGSMSVHSVSDISADLETGAYGIREPLRSLPEVPKSKIDAVLVPGLAFTESGRRLGRGGGYYDYFLAGYTGSCIAPCYEEQVVSEIPYTEHDQPMDFIVTQQRIITPDWSKEKSVAD